MYFLLSMTLFAICCNAVSIEPPQDQIKGTEFCAGNTPSTRRQWCNYNIDTDYSKIVPDTGVTREFWLELTDVVTAPDGFERYGQAFNGTIPGPTIEVDWGDNVVVHVLNNLKESINGSSIHFHGLRQNYTNGQDGVASITQCPTAPGHSTTYRWRATQIGSSWYHSHFEMQVYDGVYGGVIINGPASANYDEDVGLITVTDWSHITIHELVPIMHAHGTQIMANALIGGKNVFGLDGDVNQTGERYSLTFEPGKTYRMRWVNGALDSLFKLAIDNHTLTVISVDFVPVEPFEVEYVSVAIGQRVDFLVTANQAHVASSFWLRAIPQADCSRIKDPENIKGIIHYGSDNSTPTTTGCFVPDVCKDDSHASLVPVLGRDVELPNNTVYENVSMLRAPDNSVKWLLNSTTMHVEWENPSLLKIQNNETFDTSDGVIRLPKANQWVYVTIESQFDFSHPIHLHGFDYHILAQGTGLYHPGCPLSLKNPARRDTALLPARGYLVLAFYTDNPGVWLMHCHIGWHVSEGFALQFVVREDEIPALASEADIDAMNKECKIWDAYVDKVKVELQDDSGV
ncbi:hypothetical protein G7046_g5765 [Stylonectria norvegica]|nr:hypothetical protein G7046_g5765 [Stylonectria norvegica]